MIAYLLIMILQVPTLHASRVEAGSPVQVSISVSKSSFFYERLGPGQVLVSGWYTNIYIHWLYLYIYIYHIYV